MGGYQRKEDFVCDELEAGVTAFWNMALHFILDHCCHHVE